MFHKNLRIAAKTKPPSRETCSDSTNTFNFFSLLRFFACVGRGALGGRSSAKSSGWWERWVRAAANWTETTKCFYKNLGVIPPSERQREAKGSGALCRKRLCVQAASLLSATSVKIGHGGLITPIATSSWLAQSIRYNILSPGQELLEKFTVFSRFYCSNFLPERLNGIADVQMSLSYALHLIVLLNTYIL